MLRWRAWARDEGGSAALEFVTVGVILLVPLVYLVIVLGSIQEQSLGAEAAARHMARAIALAPDAASAESRSEEVLAAVVDEYGIEADSVKVSSACVPASAECPAAGATIVVTVEVTVHLPFLPSVLGIDRALAIPLEASATQKLSRQWGSE